MTADELTGPYGTAARIPPASYAEVSPAALEGWIITAPCWHPLWSQYVLSAITLADVPGVPPARKLREGVTHELMVLALSPDHGPYDAAKIGAPGSLRFLTPHNVAEQFTGTDDQARELAALCARAVVDGLLCPETADAPNRIRESWRVAIHQTIDHFRDPNHGRAERTDQ